MDKWNWKGIFSNLKVIGGINMGENGKEKEWIHGNESVVIGRDIEGISMG